MADFSGFRASNAALMQKNTVYRPVGPVRPDRNGGCGVRAGSLSVTRLVTPALRSAPAEVTETGRSARAPRSCPHTAGPDPRRRSGQAPSGDAGARASPRAAPCDPVRPGAARCGIFRTGTDRRIALRGLTGADGNFTSRLPGRTAPAARPPFCPGAPAAPGTENGFESCTQSFAPAGSSIASRRRMSSGSRKSPATRARSSCSTRCSPSAANWARLW